ncbi:SusC/RagA family TonB-linked outer membrane protein [Flavobacterium aciduliphilum]|uniref:Iron complex outermembrane receptor protein n=1 Tax=Flavobacterium aciduliphilum TaxID=1101402 RepID=A0A328YJ50_9FLAO|nr:SusC/RagA family TonB-linked outer membrane protein [Flavobacterium aciduliphilum]RAR74091.1 iron complex outermembrane receptor protein [Flavobacterium aciduliphilum]
MKTIYKKLLYLLLILPFGVFAQTLEGTVVDAKTKKAIPGVNVIVTQGAQQSTTTDLDGKFKLVKLQNGNVIKFSYIGYKNEMVTYKGQKEVVVSLDEEANTLQEVVVQVGYGSVKKKDATGSVAVITNKDFNKGAITTVEGLLDGRAAGVVITGSGTPGNGGNITIRGGSSLSASNNALIVVDGLPITGDITSVNPNDIESFSILKDASASAIYGNRGSNGVIIITTKKGTKKGLQVDFNTFTTYNTLAKKIDVYSADEFRNLVASINPSATNLLSNGNTDWQKEIFKPSFTSDVSLSMSGNIGGVLPSRLSISNTDNNGILLTSNYKRTTVSTSLNPSFLKDHLKFNITANYSYAFRRSADEGAIGSAISADPTRPVYDSNSIFAGYTEWTTPGPNPGSIYPNGNSNPVALLLEKRDISNNNRFFGNLNMEYKFHFLPELKFIFNGGIDITNGDGSVTTNPNARIGWQPIVINNSSQLLPIGYYQTTWWHSTNKNVSYQLDYAKKFNKFNLDAIVGYNYQEFNSNSYYSGNKNAYVYGVLNDVYSEVKASDVYTDPGNKLNAVFGRVNLGYNDKYLLTANYRRDGSSRISPVNKYKSYLGYAFAWKINQENFMKDIKSISELKLRLGYGEVGQQDIPVAYDWFKRYSTSNNNYYQFGNDFIIISKPQGYNENLKWESSKKYNVGLDLGLFNNRLKITTDVYLSKTYDLFSQVAEGALQNLRIYGYRNIGEFESKGIDFSVNYNAVKKKNFDLSINYNITYNKLKIGDLFSDELLVGGIGLQQYTEIHKIGLAPYSFWVYEQVYDANGKPIEGVFVDRNHDGVIDSKDKYNYKKPQADVIMGFMVNATIYQNWDFSMAWKASIGNYIYDNISSGRSAADVIVNPQSNTLNNSPVSYSDSNFAKINSSKESDYYIKNGSFLKLNNVTLGYRFNKIFGDKTGLRFYTGVQNVLTITKYKNIDPEVNGFNNGVDSGIFPRARMYMLGANVTF